MLEKRCKRCGSSMESFPDRDWITVENKLFCMERCAEEYPALDLIERAQRACFGIRQERGIEALELYCIYSSEETWQSLHDYKEEQIKLYEMDPINRGVWKAFWGFEWLSDNSMLYGDFEVR